jgi:hypothetical protein
VTRLKAEEMARWASAMHPEHPRAFISDMQALAEGWDFAALDDETRGALRSAGFEINA